jgi:hypothetical protein
LRACGRLKVRKANGGSIWKMVSVADTVVSCREHEDDSNHEEHDGHEGILVKNLLCFVSFVTFVVE